MKIASIAIACLLAALSGCVGKGSQIAPGAQQRLGAGEGALDLVALPGYVEDGSANPAFDWVTPFERRTGCQVSATVAEAPDEVIRLMRSGRYDGVSARGDVSLQLVADDLVAPVNTGLLPNDAGLFPAIKHLPDNTVDGVTYGVPNGRLANLLIWDPRQVIIPNDKPISTKEIFDPEVASKYRGRVTAYDNPMYIADAALYLRKHDPGLGIDNIYELDQRQFDAALAVLRQQRENVGRYWTDIPENVEAFASGQSVVGPGRQASVDELLKRRAKIKAAVPDEGTTGLSDTWMIGSRARHPNCMYLWLNYIIGPKANGAIAEHTGQAPANEHACDLTRDPAWCDTYRAADEEFVFNRVRYWATPLRDCGDDRGDVCKSYDDWARAFSQVTHSGR
jgi:putative spermidine/putrescine transport system substrate-binding protein